MAFAEEDKFSDELLRMMEAQIAMDAFSDTEDSLMDCESSEDEMDEVPSQNPNSSEPTNEYPDVVWSSEKFKPKIVPFEEKPMEMNPTLLVEDARELDYFLHFFDPDMTMMIVNSINETYKEFVSEDDNQAKSHLKKWHDLTLPEFYMFLSLCMIMTRNKRLRLDEHWSTDHILYSPIFGALMTRDRFTTLLFLMRTPNSAAQINILDVIINHARSKFKKTVKYPSKVINVDQHNIPFRGSIYSKREHKKTGVKLYLVRDLTTGLIIDFTLYFGGGKADQILLSNLTAPEEQIVNLLKPFHNTHRHLYLDDRFTGPRLFKQLYEKNIYACGKTFKNKPGMPNFVRNLEPGQLSVGYSEPLTATQWYLKSYVYMLSTIHDDTLTKTRKRDKVSGNLIRRPQATIDYYKNMRNHSADTSDFRVSSIWCLRPLHWHKKLLFHVVDLHLLNAYNSYRVAKMCLDRLTYSQFQLRLVRQLIETYSNGEVTLDEPFKFTRALHKPVNALPAVAAQHMPVRGEKYQRCKVCAQQKKRRDTRYLCTICQVYLCACPCFQLHHAQA